MSRLDEASLRRLRGWLESRETELQAEIRALTAEQAAVMSRNPPNQVEDLGEQGEERIRDAVRYAEKERDFAELREVEAARERLDQGSYGVCADCGVDIPFARLEARPSALRCVPCQQRLEQSRGVGPRAPAGF